MCGAGWRNVGQNSSHKFLQSTLPKAASRLRGRRGRGVSVEGGLLMGGAAGGAGGASSDPGGRASHRRGPETHQLAALIKVVFALLSFLFFFTQTQFLKSK